MMTLCCSILIFIMACTVCRWNIVASRAATGAISCKTFPGSKSVCAQRVGNTHTQTHTLAFSECIRASSWWCDDFLVWKSWRLAMWNEEQSRFAQLCWRRRRVPLNKLFRLLVIVHVDWRFEQPEKYQSIAATDPGRRPLVANVTLMSHPTHQHYSNHPSHILNITHSYLYSREALSAQLSNS